jgi:hypothetical protein
LYMMIGSCCLPTTSLLAAPGLLRLLMGDGPALGPLAAGSLCTSSTLAAAAPPTAAPPTAAAMAGPLAAMALAIHKGQTMLMWALSGYAR